jgi:thiopeptide-type bacteriocin biosynthesis protein
MEVLATPNPQSFPQSFAALTSLEASSLAALDRGEFQFWMEHYSGPTAARWLGRFASGDLALKAALQKHLQKEESLHPEAVFAEVVHVPEGRMGNVLARPAMRGYEIPFLATSGVSSDKTLFPSDLQLTVRGDRVFLASTRLGREVIPRLSSAHNFARGPAVYRFLAHLQDQDGRPGGWSWGVLAEQPFLPRVTRGPHVLSKARWRLEARELKEAMTGTRDGAWGAFQILRESRRLPRFVMLTDADNNLLVDLDQVLWVETLHHLVSSRSAFTLTECFPDPGQALVTAPEGWFAHELVIPLEATSPAQPKAAPLASMSNAPRIRAYPPGSEWLYLKLYCGPASADRLLVELEPLLRRTQAEGLWDRWHFVRYRDPDHHVRLRFHGVPIRLLSELLPQFHQHLEAPLAQGLLWKVQVDTFGPEWERYGGSIGFALAEGWFFADSQHILNHLVDGMTLEQRWRAGLRNSDAIWAALGLSIQVRKGLAQAARDGFRKEFGDSGEGAVQMGARFRELRKELESGFPRAVGSPFGPELGGLLLFREAFEQRLIQADLVSLAGSLSHMHLNRLLRNSPREHEWVLMEFLVRLYESWLARFPETQVPSPTIIL